jgi:hypothetical protein
MLCTEGNETHPKTRLFTFHITNFLIPSKTCTVLQIYLAQTKYTYKKGQVSKRTVATVDEMPTKVSGMVMKLVWKAPRTHEYQYTLLYTTAAPRIQTSLHYDIFYN